ncbi:MAG TPA: ImmA/IrrE family metallo-endopeptidase [Terriglobia bacterium]|nr:ImmA/IrrE family metallo-endopeptidase [Terriglobia bacterium]
MREFHAEGSLPTPIEEIAEIKCALEIIPLPGLRDLLEIDGFISSDLSCITVDQFVLERRLNRYRFTLAHELGHLYMHRDIYSELKFGTLKEWKEFQMKVDEADYGWLEYQAYAFAGLVLVPTGHLKSQFQSAAETSERIGFSRQGEPEAFLEYVTEVLREVFQVSDAVITKRLRYENLDR